MDNGNRCSRIYERLSSMWAQRDARIYLILPYLIVAILFILLPVCLLIYYAIQPDVEVDRLVINNTVSKVLWRSIWTALVAAALVVVISTIYILCVLWLPSVVVQRIMISLLLMPLIIFTITKVWSLRGLYMQFFYRDPNELNAYWFLILGMVYLYLPLGAIPIYIILSSIPRNIIEASSDLGCNWYKTLIRVILPYSLRAIVTGYTTVFLTAATSIVLSEKLLPNSEGHTLIGNVIVALTNPYNKYDFVQLVTITFLTLGVLLTIYSLLHGLVLLLTNRRRIHVHRRSSIG